MPLQPLTFAHTFWWFCLLSLNWLISGFVCFETYTALKSCWGNCLNCLPWLLSVYSESQLVPNYSIIFSFTAPFTRGSAPGRRRWSPNILSWRSVPLNAVGLASEPTCVGLSYKSSQEPGLPLNEGGLFLMGCATFTLQIGHGKTSEDCTQNFPEIISLTCLKGRIGELSLY